MSISLDLLNTPVVSGNQKTYAVVGISSITVRAGARVVAGCVLAERFCSARSGILALVDI